MPSSEKDHPNMSSLNDLPMNSAIQSTIIDAVKKVDDEDANPSICCTRCREEDDEHNDAVKYCQDCQLPLCIGQSGSVIDSGLVSVEHSVISDVPSKATVDKETHFTVQLKTKDGQIVQHGICPNITITDAQNQNVGYEMVFNENENAFRVRFTPKSDGSHVVQATVHGQHLNNSPFSVQVDLPSKEPMFKFVAKFGSKGSSNGQFNCPFFVATDNQGNIYVSDYNNHRIQIFDSNGHWMGSIGSKGSGNGQFNGTRGIAFNSKSHMFVADCNNHRIVEFDQNMQFVKAFGSEGNENGQFKSPAGIAVDADDNIVVADYYNDRFQIFSKDGNWKKTIGKRGSGEFDCPWGVAVCKTSGRIFVSDEWNHRVQVFSSDGKFLFKFGSRGSENGQFICPSGLALSDCGQYLFVCDWDNHRIQLFNRMNGEFVESYGSKGSGDGQFKYPSGICLSQSGQIIVSETGNNQHRVQIFE